MKIIIEKNAKENVNIAPGQSQKPISMLNGDTYKELEFQ